MPNFFQAVIEGFYGRQWSWSQRESYAAFLQAAGYQAYIYAPKGDAFLRSRWREVWPSEVFTALQQLSQTYLKHDVSFGVGFSPMGLFERYTNDDALALKQKVYEINRLQPRVLCILFDDMKGDVPNLAARQLQIVEDILAVSEAEQHIVCPSYYSFDPVLEELFGAMPSNYLAELSGGLPQDVGFFWTGDKVISKQLLLASLERIERIIGRKPILWDNVFANDGRRTADFLPLDGADYRGNQLLGAVSGAVVNPMSQSELAKVMLDIYSRKLHGGEGDYLLAEFGPAGSLLHRDKSLFADCGRPGLPDDRVGQLISEYAAVKSPAALDVVDWLKGEYGFDPACLTG